MNRKSTNIIAKLNKWLFNKISFDITTFLSIILFITLTILGYITIIPFEKAFGIMGTILIFNFLSFSIRIIDKMDKFKPLFSLDDMLEKFWEDTDEKKLVAVAEKKIELLQETGYALLSDAYFKEKLNALLGRGGSVKIVTCLPKLKCFTYIAMRNIDMALAANLVKRQSHVPIFLSELTTEEAGRIVLRYCPYPIALTQTIIDSDNTGGRMIVRFADFQVPYEAKRGINITNNDASNTFEFYKEQYDNYAFYSYKKIMIDVSSEKQKKAVLGTLLGGLNEHYRSNVEVITPEDVLNGRLENALSDYSDRIIILDCITNSIIDNVKYGDILDRLLQIPDVVIFAFRIRKNISDIANSRVNEMLKRSYAEVVYYSGKNKKKIMKDMIKEINKSVEMINVLQEGICEE